jgi:uncharacterized protein YdeI (YjbR/CyaY-like superfamily)
MGKKVLTVDEYIANSEEFAQPILTHLRRLVHQACPQIQEAIKWSFPVFEYHGILCNMAAFKKHCTFGFWKGNVLSDPHQVLNQIGVSAMGQLGRIETLADLPSDEILISYLKEAMQLNEMVEKPSPKKVMEKKELIVPDYFFEALDAHPKAMETFENFSYSNKKEYVSWIVEAKTEATRQKRLQTAMEWMEEGKIKNWKYVK